MTRAHDPLPPEEGEIRTRWSEVSGGIDAAHAYAQRFTALAEQGMDLHGEARLVTSLRPPPSRVLDAGCGFGRVAIELTRLGHTCVGVDADRHLVEIARDREPSVPFVWADLADLDLRTQAFDVVVMAGNVVPYLADGTLARVLGRLHDHLVPGGLLVAGFAVGGELPRHAALVRVEDYDRAAFAAGLSLHHRWATWSRDPGPGEGTYQVSVHARPA